MGEFRVHHARFFEYSPSAIHCLSYNEDRQKLAVSRSDGSIEVWNIKDAWFQERVFPPREGCTVEAVVWAGSRLFSAGLHGEIHEHNVITLDTMCAIPSNSGAIWCLDVNEDNTKIAAGTEEGCVVIFDISDPNTVQYERAFTKQEGRILSLAWHSPQQVIVTGGVDNLRVWSTTSGHAIQRLTVGRQDRNKETIVWAVAVTKDFTIVSGDSRGKTSFWHGKQGTLKKAFNTHHADVLCVCVSKDGNSVFSAGIDPKLVQFEYVPVNMDENWSQWVPTNIRSQHTHDVRALAVAGEHVVSGGVDCHIIYNTINPPKLQKGVNKTEKSVWRRIPPLPQSPMVCFAPEQEIVLVRYADYLELWKLGATNAKSEKNGEILPLSKNPIKLLQLRSRGGEPIVTATLSQNATHLAYADPTTIRLFTVEVNDSLVPGIAVKKIRNVPTESLAPARCLCFTPDGATLIATTTDGCVQVLDIGAAAGEDSGEKGEDGVSVRHTFPAVKAAKTTDSAESCHLLSVCPKGKYAAVADHSNNVHIYNIKKGTSVCSLPTSSSAVTALAFHPKQALLAVAYADQKIYEFDIKEEEYSNWSREFVRRLHPFWKQRPSPLTQLFYHPHSPHLLFARDEAHFFIIDKTEALPEPTHKLFRAKTGIHSCTKFKYLLFLAAGADDFLLVVERPPLAITETLPAALKTSKFGT